jgi:nucleoside-diphosphate-sugar epimerase
MEIFISGISGFVGQNLKSYLKNGFDVKGISRLKGPEVLTYEMFFEKDRAYDAFVHLAGKAHDLKRTSNDDEYFEANYELTKKIFDQFLKSEAQQFIFVSSVKSSADEVKGTLTEEMKANPITAYGKSKQMAEKYILSNLPKDKKVYILRPCMIHGPGNKGNLNLLYGMVTKRIPYPLGAFKNMRSFLSIENLCFVISELLAQKNIPSGVYQVADDLSLSTNRVVELMGDSLGIKSKIWNIPCGFVNLAARLGSHLHLPLNTNSLQKLTGNYVVSNQKIVAAIGKPLPIKSKDGLLKTFKSFKH